jgi:hypothetical protein
MVPVPLYRPDDDAKLAYGLLASLAPVLAAEVLEVMGDP